MMAAPAISAFTFASGATVINNGGNFNRTAADGLTFNVTATPDTVNNKVAKVQIVADNDNSGTISEGDVILGVAKATGTANQFSLTVKGKRANYIPAGFANKTVNFIAVATAKDKSIGSDPNKYLNVIGNMLPDVSNATVVIAGPTKNSGVAANSVVHFKLKGFADPDGKIASYILLWDADNSGNFTPSFDYSFGTITKTNATATIPANNGKLGGNLRNFPTASTVSFLVLAIDNDGESSVFRSNDIPVKRPPSISSTITRSISSGKTTFTISNIAKGETVSKPTKLLYFLDSNNDNKFQFTDRKLGSFKLPQGALSVQLTVKNSVLADFSGVKAFAVVVDDLGFVSNVASITL
jgi:hypothetical protein